MAPRTKTRTFSAFLSTAPHLLNGQLPVEDFFRAVSVFEQKLAVFEIGDGNPGGKALALALLEGLLPAFLDQFEKVLSISRGIQGPEILGHELSLRPVHQIEIFAASDHFATKCFLHRDNYSTTRDNFFLFCCYLGCFVSIMASNFLLANKTFFLFEGDHL